MRFFPLVPLFVLLPIAVVAAVLLIICLIRPKLRKRKNIRRTVMLVLMAIILARPAFMNGQAKSELNNLNFYFVVDATNSMSAEDVEGKGRYVKVAKDIYEITKAFPGSRYAVIVEDFKVYTAVPSTTSMEFLSSIWSENEKFDSGNSLVAPKAITYSRGSDLETLLEKADDQIRTYAKRYPTRTNVVFFMSDGENTAGDTISNHATLKNTISGGAVFGYGTVEGDKIVNNGRGLSQVEDSSKNCLLRAFEKTYKTVDYCIVSSLDEDSLRKISNNLGLQYYHRENGGIPKEVLDNINSLISYSSSDESAVAANDIYWIFSIILIGLLLWDFREVLDNVMREREFKHA